MFAGLWPHFFPVGLKEFMDAEITEFITNIPLNTENLHMIHKSLEDVNRRLTEFHG